MQNLYYLQIITFSAILIFSVDGKVARVKRQSTFRVISDGQEFPCEGPKMAEYEAMGIPRIELNDEQKMELFHQLGGEFLSSFMGISGQPGKPYSERGMEKSPWRIGKKINRRGDSFGAVILEPHGEDQVDNNGDLMNTPAVYEYCVNRTDPIAGDPQYLFMCTSCAKSTTNSKDIWPSEFYETDCLSWPQNACLYYQGSSHGKCQQAKQHVSVLRKKEATCMIVLADGSTVVTEDWYLSQMTINVGCECAVNKDSDFR